MKSTAKRRALAASEKILARDWGGFLSASGIFKDPPPPVDWETLLPAAATMPGEHWSVVAAKARERGANPGAIAYGSIPSLVDPAENVARLLSGCALLHPSLAPLVAKARLMDAMGDADPASMSACLPFCNPLPLAGERVESPFPEQATPPWDRGRRRLVMAEGLMAPLRVAIISLLPRPPQESFPCIDIACLAGMLDPCDLRLVGMMTGYPAERAITAIHRHGLSIALPQAAASGKDGSL